MNKKIWWQSPEMIVALAALIVSVFAVVVGAYSAFTDRTYARASVWPNLQVSTKTSSEAETAVFALNIHSTGIGPAIIKHAEARYKGNLVTDFSELLAPMNDQFARRDWSKSSLNGLVLPPNKGQNAFRLSAPDVDLVEQFRLDMKHLELTLCYCSVYEECWQVSKSTRAKKVEYCPASIEQKVKY